MHPSPETPDKSNSSATSRAMRTHRTMIIVLSLALAWVIYQQVGAQYAANVATGTAHDLGEVVNEQCQKPTARREIGDEKCNHAAEVVRESTVVLAPKNGEDGKKGDDGRGITNTAVVDGHLYVTYTDGVREDKGVIAVNGKNGRGITGASLRDGSLVLTFTDGTSETVGQIVGRDGERGRGIDDVTVTSDYRVMVTYSDGTVEDVGALPPGPSGPTGETGKPGRSVETIDFNMADCTATIHYVNSDGSRETETKPMTGCDTGEPTPPPSTTTVTSTTTVNDGLLPTY